mmetsp:Transcript_1792/g.2535  ORF Transcript_1792/g.2535 Transcript_1792/m.2535 type:complete len:284 (+) Transcript_1792:179-1030(+)|eukprot:CAMPEP_0196590378 /NCGR_PEP_ID=MMETSP1081-20130531/66468_1 /TAXON_ID=36882 /ORGANISM="Pyramimonas amylifera, Strain CCMP720" /LENGTH=283 /DNA_ID=CAMNT_0041913467 /DNA_START=136 /DNA_END=987 /DNA_ORIENTATION=+
MEILSGAAAGVVECVVVQPFDIVKTRFHLNSGVNVSVPAAIRSLVKEGGALRLYRGLLPELAGGMPRSSAMYATYTWAQRGLTARLLPEKGGSTLATAGVHFLAGGVSGIPEALVATPFQVVKIRLQSKEHLGRYANSFDCVRKVTAEEGMLALSQGVRTTIMRNNVWNSVYFGLMHILNTRTQEYRPAGYFSQVAFSLGVGSAAGAVATTCNAPLDMAKSRIQSQPTNSVALKYSSTFQTLGLVLREEGVLALYKGFTPKLIRMTLGGAVGITSFDFFNKYL